MVRKLSLILILAGIVLVPAVALAQSGSTKVICVSYAGSGEARASTNGQCSSLIYSPVTVPRATTTVCMDLQNHTTTPAPLDTNGNALPCPSGTVSKAISSASTGTGTGTGGTGSTGGTGGTGSTGGTGGVSSDSFDNCLGRGEILCLPDNPFSGAKGIAGATSAQDLITRIINTMLFLAGILAVIFIIVGGYLYITSRGNEAQAKKGAAALTYSVIGLILVVLSYVLVNVVVSFLTT